MLESLVGRRWTAGPLPISPCGSTRWDRFRTRHYSRTIYSWTIAKVSDRATSTFCRRHRAWAKMIGVPRDIVSPGVVQVIIQEDRWKQAELERPARLELLDDLPGAEVLFVGVGADEVEVELIGKGLGKEVAAAGERFQV